MQPSSPEDPPLVGGALGVPRGPAHRRHQGHLGDAGAAITITITITITIIVIISSSSCVLVTLDDVCFLSE